MNWTQNLSGVAIQRLPKVISPKGHAIADYLMAAGAFAAAIAFFKSNRKMAGVGALIAGAVETANPLMTNFPGGVFKKMSFPTHGRVDVAATSMVASMPKLMGFSDGVESKFFYIHAATAMAVIGLTDFGGESGNRQVIGGTAS